MASLRRILLVLFVFLIIAILTIPNDVKAQNNKSNDNTPSAGDETTTETTVPPTGKTTATTDEPKTSDDDSSTSDSSNPTNKPAQPTSSNAPASSTNGNNGNTKQPGLTTTRTATSGGTVITITSTETDPTFGDVPTSVKTPAKNENSNSNNSSDSGSSANVVTAAIVVGTVVIAAAIGIWIFRKWKLTPSRNFKEKIQPVSFTPRSAESDTVFLRELNEP